MAPAAPPVPRSGGGSFAPKPRRRNRHAEWAAQEAIALWMERSLPRDGSVWWTGYDLLIPVNSEAEAGWAARAGGLRRRRGIKPGVPDFLLLSSTYAVAGTVLRHRSPGLLVLLEVKTNDGARSPEQVAMHANLSTAGAVVFVVRNSAEVEACLRSLGIPVLSRDLFPVAAPAPVGTSGGARPSRKKKGASGPNR